MEDIYQYFGPYAEEVIQTIQSIFSDIEQDYVAKGKLKKLSSGISKERVADLWREIFVENDEGALFLSKQKEDEFLRWVVNHLFPDENSSDSICCNL